MDATSPSVRSQPFPEGGGASRFVPTMASNASSQASAASLVVTLSFLVTTPNLEPALGAFIIKDLTLLGVALWSAGEALSAEWSLTGRRTMAMGRPAPALS